MNEEIIKKARDAKAVEELIALIQGNDIWIADAQAKVVFDRFHTAAGELSDDELDLNAAGEVDSWRKLPDDGEKP